MSTLKVVLQEGGIIPLMCCCIEIKIPIKSQIFITLASLSERDAFYKFQPQQKCVLLSSEVLKAEFSVGKTKPAPEVV